ncbi:DNA repair protein RAD51 homolog 4 isoform X2 [Momordica charantia]|uniref:DNA repair protein RAD51 homolog 4 isoform X2 n=1 Tax=Momordica charantia TaxID=3673 RepID=A0A6J1D466_MOMCH|nr:DNA repair protein RAD51 homolog 4 isoform X2 [Momordica charantia]
MAPLKSLERVYPIIDSNFQNFCSSHGIFTVEDFLVHDLYVLAAFAEQQPASEKLKQGITEVLSIIDAKRQPWMNGLELLEDAGENKHILSTGCEGVDALLGGGLREGQLTEIVGPSSSGKTQVCLRAASNVAMKYNANVFYLDTGNSFSPHRISDFVHWKSASALDGTEHSILQQVMSSISCHSVFDIFAMFDVLHELEFSLRSQMCKGDRRVQLLIVDSISSLITPILAGSSSQGHALMISAGYLLKKIAHEHNIAVLVTNHTVGGDRGSSKPALGESWKSVPHVRLQLSRDPGSNFCNASILKHSFMASGITARFVIYESQEGIPRTMN